MELKNKRLHKLLGVVVVAVVGSILTTLFLTSNLPNTIRYQIATSFTEKESTKTESPERSQEVIGKEYYIEPTTSIDVATALSFTGSLEKGDSIRVQIVWGENFKRSWLVIVCSSSKDLVTAYLGASGGANIVFTSPKTDNYIISIVNLSDAGHYGFIHLSKDWSFVNESTTY